MDASRAKVISKDVSLKDKELNQQAEKAKLDASIEKKKADAKAKDKFHRE